MKLNLLTYLFALINLIVSGQNTEARKFDDILAVVKRSNGKWESYYLNKSGKIFGKDSLEFYDNSPVCESEGFICFRDSKTDKVGMFNRNGDIVIPAKYNYLNNVTNGLTVGRIGAEKHYMDKDDEHFSWEGGKVQVIDTTGKIHIDDFHYKGTLNFYSLIISDNPSDDSTRVNFKSVDGKYYSFVDFVKEFRTWLKSKLLDSLIRDNLLNATHREVAYWREPKGWIHEPKQSFIARNFDLIKAKLLQVNSNKCDYFISSEGLNPFIFSSQEFKSYFNTCGESKDWIYPILNVVIIYPNSSLSQDSFDFLRTDNGYELISMTIREGEIK